ncbi:MAG: methylenetetrahydrofolate reductase [NAD(P)H] [Clostridia bacterium]|nr:methylenetetrahydrofolate reductase [NAD(P)H] [Clostridia bacterium]
MAEFSIEVFPPKDNSEADKIFSRLAEFSALSPDYISVTYRKGGEKFTGEVASYIQNELGIPGVAHLTCTWATRHNMLTTLDNLRQKGIKRILALRGDVNEEVKTKDFRYATDLIEFIKEYGGFEVFVTCYPEGHPDSRDFAEDLNIMKKKAELGVSNFVSQLFFDNSDFYRMVDSMREWGINTPVQAGIMPLTNIKQILRIVSLSGAKLPAKLTKMVQKFENNPEALYQAGLNYAVEQISDLLINGADGIHLYSMNNPKLANYIFESIRPIIKA